MYEEGGPQTRLAGVIEVNDGYILGGVVDADQYSGSEHFCLIKINSAGGVVWKSLGTFERSQVSFQTGALTKTSDGGYLLVGTFLYAPPSAPVLVLTRVDGNGKLEYSKTLPVGDNPIFPWLSGSVTWALQASDRGFLLLNNQGQSHPISPSSTSLMKIDPNGNVQWTQSYGGAGNYYHTTGACVVVLSDGYLIGGTAAPQHSWSGGVIIRTDLEGNMLWNRTYTSPNYVYTALNSTQGGFLLLGAGTDASDSKMMHIWLWQTNAAGEIQTESDLLKVNIDMFSKPSQLAPAGGGVVFTGSFFYERSFEGGVSTSATNRFWVAKASVLRNGTALGGSGFSVSEVAVLAGVTAATVIAVGLLLRHRKKGI